MVYYSDTGPEIEKIQCDLLQQDPVGKKLMMVAHLNQAAIEMALSGLRRQYPGESPVFLYVWNFRKR